MVDLAITITAISELDYDGVNEDTRKITGTLDSVPITEVTSCPSTASDADCKTSFKNSLTTKGYTWDTES